MSLLKPLFEEASKRFDSMKTATEKDIGAIVSFMEKQERKGYFYYPIDRSRLRYNLFCPEYVRQIINDEKDLVVVVPDNGEIKAFTHWGLDEGIVWNYYTVVREKTNGIGAKIYDAFMPVLNNAGQDYAADFVETPFMARLCNLWARFGAKPFALFAARYSDKKGSPLASTMFGRFFGEDDGFMYVPGQAEGYARALVDMHENRRLILTVNAPMQAAAVNTGLEEMVAFHDRDAVACLTNRGYMLAGIMPGRGMIFSPATGVGMDRFRTAAGKSSGRHLKKAFALFDNYLSAAEDELNGNTMRCMDSDINKGILGQRYET